ncbi:unnamed protein product [Closterium sp. NIES-54]
MGVSIATAAASYICLSLNLTLCHLYRASPSPADTVAGSVPVARTVVVSSSPAECGERVSIRATSALAATMRDFQSVAGQLSWLPVIDRDPSFLSEQWSEQLLQGSPWRATCPSPFLKSDVSLLALPPATSFLRASAAGSTSPLRSRSTPGGEAYNEDGEGDNSEGFPSPAALAAAAAAAGNEAALCVEFSRERSRRADRAARRASRQTMPSSGEEVGTKARGGGREGRGEEGRRRAVEEERSVGEERGRSRRGRRSQRREEQERERERRKQEEEASAGQQGRQGRRERQGREERSEERRKARGEEERSERWKGGQGTGVREEGRRGGGRGGGGKEDPTFDVASALETAIRLVQMGDHKNAFPIFAKVPRSVLSGAVRCRAVRCGAVLCCAVQCGAVPCRAVRCSAVSCFAVLSFAVSCRMGHPMPIPCHPMPIPCHPTCIHYMHSPPPIPHSHPPLFYSLLSPSLPQSRSPHHAPLFPSPLINTLTHLTPLPLACCCRRVEHRRQWCCPLSQSSPPPSITPSSAITVPFTPLPLTLQLQESGAQETVVLLAWRGMAHAFAEHYEEALSDFNKALEQAPKAGQILRQRASVLGILGRHKESLALTATGAPFKAVKSYETAMAMNADVKEGIHLQSDPLPFSPLSTPLYPSPCLQGLALTATGAPFKAVKSYETAMAMNADGLALTATGAPFGAVKSYETAMAMNQVNEGENRPLPGAPFEAVKSYETAMAMNPDVKEGWTNWGQTMKEIAMFNESERCYKRSYSHTSSWPRRFSIPPPPPPTPLPPPPHTPYPPMPCLILHKPHAFHVSPSPCHRKQLPAGVPALGKAEAQRGRPQVRRQHWVAAVGGSTGRQGTGRQHWAAGHWAASSESTGLICIQVYLNGLAGMGTALLCCMAAG